MKYIMIARHFPELHSKAGEPTWFVEKTMACLAETVPSWMMPKQFEHYNPWKYMSGDVLKQHTIRNTQRFKAGETISLRCWSGAPYRSGQAEFAQVPIRVWPVQVEGQDGRVTSLKIDGVEFEIETAAYNDGLSLEDFDDWFVGIHHKSVSFTGQIIAWGPVKYIHDGLLLARLKAELIGEHMTLRGHVFGGKNACDIEAEVLDVRLDGNVLDTATGITHRGFKMLVRRSGEHPRWTTTFSSRKE